MGFPSPLQVLNVLGTGQAVPTGPQYAGILACRPMTKTAVTSVAKRLCPMDTQNRPNLGREGHLAWHAFHTRTGLSGGGRSSATRVLPGAASVWMPTALRTQVVQLRAALPHLHNLGGSAGKSLCGAGHAGDKSFNDMPSQPD